MLLLMRFLSCQASLEKKIPISYTLQYTSAWPQGGRLYQVTRWFVDMFCFAMLLPLVADEKKNAEQILASSI